MTQLQNVPADCRNAAVLLVSSKLDPLKGHTKALQLPATPLHKTKAPKKVLLVEDNLDSVQTMLTLLRDIGHRAVFALNGQDALDLAQRLRPDFVLLDLGLPGMSGFDVCLRIKADPLLKAARVIAITAYAEEKYGERSKAVGCELHLVKPVSPRLLEELLG